MKDYTLLLATRLREFRENTIRKSPEQLVSETPSLFTVEDIEHSENPKHPYLHQVYFNFLMMTHGMSPSWWATGLGSPINQTNHQSGANSNTQVGGSNYGNCGTCKLPDTIDRLTDRLASATDKLEKLQEENRKRQEKRINYLTYNEKYNRK